MHSPHGLRFSETAFWVIHRNLEYGPFDYEWSREFDGIEMTFRGRKFGEYCSEDEMFADLAEFRLPMAVVEVAAIALGCTIRRVLNGLGNSEGDRLIADQLRQAGYERFANFTRGGAA